MQHTGYGSRIFCDLCEVGTDRTEPDPLGKILYHHAIPMKHGATGVLGGEILTIDIKAHEIVEFKAALLPQVGVRDIRHDGPLAHAQVRKVARPELSSRGEDHGTDCKIIVVAEMYAGR